MTTAITGVTGKLGSGVAKGLSDMKIPTKLIVRRPEAVENLPNTTINQAHYDNSLMTFETLTGVDILFMVSAKESANRMNEHKVFIDTAKSAGVKRIIYTSFYNAGINSTFTLAREHAETEAYIREQGFTFTLYKR